MLLSIAAWGDTTATVDGIKYILDGSNATVTYPNDSKPDDGSNASTYSGAITIPSTITVETVNYNVTAIGDYAFRSAGITSISLPEGLLSIGYKAIYKTGITQLTIPNSVTTLGQESLSENSNLTTITLGSHIADNKLASWAFWRTSGAYEVYMICDTKPELSHNETFDDTHASTIHVEADLFDAYKADPNWNIYNIVGDLVNGEQVALTSFTEGGLKYKMITANKVAVTYPNDSEPGTSTYTGDINVPSTVTHEGKEYKITAIGDKAFRKAAITSISLPEGITSIGKEAIYGTNITKIVIPNSVSSIGESALSKNSSLTKVVFGKNASANKWGVWVCWRSSGAYDVYMICDAVPNYSSGEAFNEDYGTNNTTVHVWHSLETSYKNNSKWSKYNIVGDLDYTYYGLQGTITSSEKIISDEVSDAPGFYSSASAATLSSAIAAAKLLNEDASSAEITTAVNNITAGKEALTLNPLIEGYYYIENLYTEKMAYTDPAYAENGGVKAEKKSTANTNKAKFYFKLTADGDNWIVQGVDHNNKIWYVGGLEDDSNTNGKYIKITTAPGHDLKITRKGLGQFEICCLYDDVNPSYPYTMSTTYSDYAWIEDTSDEERTYWRFYPASFSEEFKGILSKAEVKDKLDNATGTYLDLSSYSFVADDLTSQMPDGSNLLVKVKSGSEATGQNIVNDGVCQSLVLTDGQPFGYYKDITATAASYERTVTNKFGTICLPFAVSSDENAQYYTLNKVENSTLYLTTAATVEAGVPAVFEMKNGTMLTAIASDATVKGSVVNGDGTLKLIGTFASETITTNLSNSYYISSDKFRQATNSITVNPFRAYFATTSNEVKAFDLSTEDNETAINNVQSSISDVQSIYDANGMELQSLRKGLNIVKMNNGNVQKIMVK